MILNAMFDYWRVSKMGEIFRAIHHEEKYRCWWRIHPLWRYGWTQMVHFPLPGWITYSKQASVFEMWDPNFGDVTCILSITYFQCVPYMHSVFIYIYIHRLGKNNRKWRNGMPFWVKNEHTEFLYCMYASSGVFIFVATVFPYFSNICLILSHYVFHTHHFPMRFFS